MIFLRYIITIFFIYILISLSVLRFSVVYLENNKELLESYLSYVNYNYIIKRSGTEESENFSKKNHEMGQIKIQDIKGNWRGVYPSLSLKIKNLSDYKSSNVRFPNLIELKINIYKSAIFFKPVIKSLYIENVYYKSSLEKIFSKLKESNKIKSINIDNIQIGNSKFEILYKNNSYKLENTNIIGGKRLSLNNSKKKYIKKIHHHHSPFQRQLLQWYLSRHTHRYLNLSCTMSQNPIQHHQEKSKDLHQTPLRLTNSSTTKNQQQKNQATAEVGNIQTSHAREAQLEAASRKGFHSTG